MRERQRSVDLDFEVLGQGPAQEVLGDVREELLEMPFENPITVFALQQGVGKTHMFVEYAKDNWQDEKIVFASPRHNHLSEIMKKLGRNKANHWYGFSYQDRYGHYRGCPRLNENIPLVNSLKNDNDYQKFLTPKVLCNILCDERQCRYYAQFGESQQVDLMPLEYLGTDVVYNQSPDIVFIDEAIDKIDQYRYDGAQLEACREIAEEWEYDELEDRIASLIPKPDDRIEEEALGDIEEDKNKLLSELVGEEAFDEAVTFSRINGNLAYFRHAPSYENNYYYRPKIYNAFDLLSRGIRVVFLNASFNEALFTYFLEHHPNPMGDITVPVYRSDLINEESTVIRVFPDNNFWKAAFYPRSVNRVLHRINEVIEVVENHVPRNDIGIITYQKAEDENGEKVYVENKFKKDYDTAHFWAESGLNYLEDKTVLFIIGTPYISDQDVIRIWEKIHNEETNLTTTDIGGRDTGYTRGLDDALIEIGEGQHERLETLLPDDGEEYDFSPINKKNINQTIDSIHRNRPLAHSRIVIALGYVPHMPRVRCDPEQNEFISLDDINYKVGTIYHEVEDLDGLEDIIEEHPAIQNYDIRKTVKYILDNKGYMSRRHMAKALSLWDDNNNPNIGVVRNIERALESTREALF